MIRLVICFDFFLILSKVKNRGSELEPAFFAGAGASLGARISKLSGAEASPDAGATKITVGSEPLVKSH